MSAFGACSAPAPQALDNNQVPQGPKGQVNPMAEQILCAFMGIPDISIFGSCQVGYMDVVEAYDAKVGMSNDGKAAQLKTQRDAYDSKPGIHSHLQVLLDPANIMAPVAPRPMAFGMAA